MHAPEYTVFTIVDWKILLHFAKDLPRKVSLIKSKMILTNNSSLTHVFFLTNGIEVKVWLLQHYFSFYSLYQSNLNFNELRFPFSWFVYFWNSKKVIFHLTKWVKKKKGTKIRTHECDPFLYIWTSMHMTIHLVTCYINVLVTIFWTYPWHCDTLTLLSFSFRP